MGRHERESLAREAQRMALIGEIRLKLIKAFYEDLGFTGPAADLKLRRIARTIDSVLNDYR